MSDRTIGTRQRVDRGDGNRDSRGLIAGSGSDLGVPKATVSGSTAESAVCVMQATHDMERPPRMAWVTWPWTEAALIAWAGWRAGQLACVFAQRLTYPLDLEWCEGGNLYEAYRLLHRLPLYTS